MLEMPERAYEDCRVKLEKATVKNHETMMLTLPIRRCICGGTIQSEHAHAPGLRE